MYFKSEKGTYATYFVNENMLDKNTDTRMYANLSIREQVGGFAEGEEPKYEYQNWSAVFIGKKCVEKAMEVPSKTLIVLKAVDIRNHYDKTRERSYPEIHVLDFDVYQKNENA